MVFSANSFIEIKDQVVFRTNKDGTIVVMKMNDDDMFYKINGVAAEMWKMFSEKRMSLGEVATSLSIEYTVSSEKIISDAQLFLTKILEFDLIQVA